MATYSSESNSLALKSATNQLILGQPEFLAATTTISAPVPAASRTITIPDAGANSNILLSAGSQTVSGAQTFSANPTLTATTPGVIFQPSGSGNSYTFSSTASNPGQATTVNLYDPGVAA